MYQACVDDALPGAPPEVRLRAAAALQVLSSAAAWEVLRVYGELDADAAAEVVELGINSVIEGLRVQYHDRSATQAS